MLGICLSVPKIIRPMMIIINAFHDAILRNTFANVKLKDVRGLPVKLHLAAAK